MMVLRVILSVMLIAGLQSVNSGTGTIEGVVLNATTGEPIPRATVILTDGKLTTNVMADDKGRFTFTSLPSATYLLEAARTGFIRQSQPRRPVNPPIQLAPDQKLSGVTLRLVPTATVSGRVYDALSEAIPSIQVSLLRPAYQADGTRTLTTVQSVTTNDLGEYRLFWIPAGRYYIRADIPANRRGINGVPLEELGPATDSLLATFFPGTIDEMLATPIDVSAGAVVSALDFAVIRTKTFRVRGRLVSPVLPQRQNSISVSLLLQGSRKVLSSDSVSSADLTFEILNVPPGRYDAVGQLFGATRLEATVPVEVTNGDVEGVNIVLSGGYQLTGRIVLEGVDRAGRAPPLRIQLAPRNQSASAQAVPADENGLFTVPTLLPGSYELKVLGIPNGYYVKSARLGIADVLRDGLTLDRPPDSSIEIVVSANAGRVAGTVLDGAGQVAPFAHVTLLPIDRRRQDLYRSIDVNRDGVFEFIGLAPGEYRLFAWHQIEPGAQHDPEFMRKYEPFGVAVTVREGAGNRITVRIVDP